MKFFNLSLSEKHFIFPSILNDSYAGYSNLGCRSLPFMTWNTSCQPLLACKVSFDKSADSLMGTPLQVTVSFCLAASKILSLSLIFGILIMMCLGAGLFGSILFGTLCFLDLHVYFLHQIRKVFFHYFFKQISKFLVFFSFWHPYDLNVGPLEVVPEAVYTLLIFFLILLYSCCSVWLFFASLYSKSLI